MRYRRLLGWMTVAGAAGATAVMIGQRCWRARIDALNAQLAAHADDRPHLPVSETQWRTAAATAPPPVARFLLKSIRSEAADIREVQLETRGEFRGSVDARWLPFAATQRFTTSPPAFVWDARVQMSRLVDVYVRDAYVGGRAEMVAKIGGAWTVANDVDAAPLAEGQLTRYLGETMWFPTALIPGRSVIWTPIDDRSATATLTDRGRTVRLKFTFTGDDDIAEVFAADRMRAVDGGYDATPWTVRCSEHEWRGQVRIPIRCEAEWQLPGGPLAYWRGRVAAIRFGSVTHD